MPVPNRDDSLQLDFGGGWERLNRLRTPVAAFAVLHFPVPRPRSLLYGDCLPAIVAAVNRVRLLGGPHPPPESFRIDAAGAGSPDFGKLAEQLAAATRLRHDQTGGDLALRFRRSPGGDGWDVLVRLSARPLSKRLWRVSDRPGAANATIAAAMAFLSGPRAHDRLANPMCGSGTLLIERLLAAPAAGGIAFDLDEAALQACSENLRAAGLSGKADVMLADVSDPKWTEFGPFDTILADPPWGARIGDHRDNEALHLALLRRAREAAAGGARFVVLTQEVRRMERCLRRTADLWRVEQEIRVYAKGHHPRIYLLRPV